MPDITPDPIALHVGQVKDKWRKEFRDTIDQIKSLEKKLDDLKRKLAAADEILEEAKSTDVKGDALTGMGKYAGMGLTDAIKAFFCEHKYTGYSISTLTDRLEAEGVKSDAQNLRQSIYITCRRLEKDEHFLRSDWQGTFKAYSLSDNAGNGSTAAASKKLNGTS